MSDHNRSAYDPETVNLLRSVLDQAWNSLSSQQRDQTTKADMALRILKLAMAGERDPAWLRNRAVMGVISAKATSMTDGVQSDFEKKSAAASARRGDDPENIQKAGRLNEGGTLHAKPQRRSTSHAHRC